MRNENEMMKLIIGTAETDDRIRAVLMVGSRANPDAPKDKYQDFDIGYYVKDIAPFYNNLDWIKEKFGQPTVLQLPESMKLLPPVGDGHCTYLMIFEDGNRIDLSIDNNEYIDDGEPAIVLLDKDGFLPKLPSPNGAFWNIKPPIQKLFSDCCNEFWWCLNNTAKGIARDELPYAMSMYNVYIREMLDKMIEWYIGINSDFSVSAGKMGKYFKRYLPADLYEMYRRTYSGGEYDDFWNAIFTACDLFRTTALAVAGHFGYKYNEDEERGMREYMRKVKDNVL